MANTSQWGDAQPVFRKVALENAASWCDPGGRTFFRPPSFSSDRTCPPSFFGPSSGRTCLHPFVLPSFCGHDSGRPSSFGHSRGRTSPPVFRPPSFIGPTSGRPSPFVFVFPSAAGAATIATDESCPCVAGVGDLPVTYYAG